MEHGKNMDYAEEIKALKKALAERDAIIAKQKRDYDALEAKFRKLQEKLEEKVKELEAIQEKRRVERARIFVPKTETMKDEPEEQVVNEAEGCRREERGKPGRKRDPGTSTRSGWRSTSMTLRSCSPRSTGD